MAQTSPNPFEPLQRLCDDDDPHWCDALECFFSMRRVYLPYAWQHFIGSKRLLFCACEEAVQHGDKAHVQRWHEALVPGQPIYQALHAKFGPRRVTYAAGLIAAAGLALTARDLIHGTDHQPTVHELCAWFKGVIDTDALAEVLLLRLVKRQTDPASLSIAASEPSPAAGIPFATLALDTLCYELSIRSLLAPERVALLWACARAWLGVPKQVIWGQREVPCASVIGTQGSVDEILVVEVLTPGTGQTFQQPEDVFWLPEHTPQQSAPVSFDEEFVTSIQDAFTVACDLAGRQAKDVDGRWRLLAGNRKADGAGHRRLAHCGQPVAAASGASASGQALRAFYGALTDTCPDTRVFLLAKVMAGGYLAKVDRIEAKTQAIADADAYDTIAVANERHNEQGEEALQGCERAGQVQVVRVETAEAACQVRSQLATDLARYYTRLRDELDLLPWSRDNVPLRASDVAIPVRVFKEVLSQRSAVRSPRAEDEFLRPDSDRRFIDPEMAALYEEPTHHREQVAWQQEQGRVDRAIILGAPGGGKSFLTQTTALWLAQQGLTHLQTQRKSLDEIPVPVHLALDQLANQSADAVADALLAPLRERYDLTPRLEIWLREHMHTPHCWLILDALDQVAVQSHLRGYLQAMNSQDWPCHVLLTCRRANFDRAQLPWSRLAVYELAPFGTNDVRHFVTQWFRNDSEQGVRLLNILTHNFSLSHACRNPLLATFTCLAHENRGVTETTRRTDLYATVLRGILRRAWREHALTDEDTHVDHLQRLLDAVARCLFLQHPASNLFTYTEVTEALKAAPFCLPFVLVQQARQKHGLACNVDPTTRLLDALVHDRDILLPLLLDELVYDCAILEGAGRNHYGETQFSFLHRTFLEYCTARAMAYELESTTEPRRVKAGWSLVARKAWLPAWQEVLIFLAGMLQDPTPLLTMLSQPAPTPTNSHGDDIFRHRLALAALCLSEVPLVYRTRHAELIDRITTEVVSYWWEHKQNGTEDAVEHLTHTLPILAQIHGRMEGVPFLHWLCQRLHGGPDASVCKAAADALKGLGEVLGQHPPVLNVLLTTLHDNPDASVRQAAAGALTGLGEALGQHPPILAALLTTLHEGSDHSVRSAVAYGLTGLGEALGQHPPILAALLTTLRDDPSDSVRWTVAEGLGRLGEALGQHPPILAALLTTLRDDPDDSVRGSAARALGRLGETLGQHPPVLAALLTTLHEDPGWSAGKGAARALRGLGEALGQHPPVLNALLTTLCDHPNPFLRRRAAAVLGGLGEALGQHPPVLTALLTTLRNPDDPVDSVHRGATWALGRLGEALGQYPSVLATLLTILRDHPKADMRQAAAMGLGGLREALGQHPPVITALLTTLRDDPEGIVREQAAWALGRLGEALGQHPPVLTALLTTLCNDPEYRVREQAAWALGGLGEALGQHQFIPAALLVALHDKIWPVREASAWALGQLMRSGLRFFQPHRSLIAALISKFACQRSSLQLFQPRHRRQNRPHPKLDLQWAKDLGTEVAWRKASMWPNRRARREQH